MEEMWLFLAETPVRSARPTAACRGRLLGLESSSSGIRILLWRACHVPWRSSTWPTWGRLFDFSKRSTQLVHLSKVASIHLSISKLPCTGHSSEMCTRTTHRHTSPHVSVLVFLPQTGLVSTLLTIYTSKRSSCQPPSPPPTKGPLN